MYPEEELRLYLYSAQTDDSSKIMDKESFERYTSVITGHHPLEIIHYYDSDEAEQTLSLPRWDFERSLSISNWCEKLWEMILSAFRL